MRKTLLVLLAAAASLVTNAQNPAAYHPQVYPQQQTTAGTASLTHEGSTYTLSNSLLSASFVHQGDKLLFGGCEAMNLKAGTELFTVKFGDGSTVVNASDMTLKSVSTETLTGNTTAVKGSHHFNGHRLKATFEYTFSGSKVTLDWYAELRDGSHYLKTDLTLKTDKDVKMFAVIPMQYTYDAAAAGSMPKKEGNTWGAVYMNDKIFFGLETPMGKNSVESTTAEAEETEGFTINQWTAADFKWAPTSIPAELAALGYTAADIIGKQGYVSFAAAGQQTATFQWNGGNLRLDVAGVDIVDPETGSVVSSDYHYAFTGGGRQQLPYNITVPEAGKTYLLRYFIDKKTDGDVRRGNSTGTITWTTTVTKQTVEHSTELADVVLQGLWDRNTTLQAVEPWNVSGIIGIVDPTQKRRTILAYSERERAVPWRPFPHYNSWWELNINRNNHDNPVDNLNESQVLDVVKQWKTNLFDKYGVGIEAFVIDDGWDQYGIWEPHAGFPDGFTNFDKLAAQMCTGIGAWLGPCGGYGGSGDLRNKYWTNQGGQHRLSYAPFYDVFKGAINNLVQNYDFRYFKFDGISQQYPHPVGPDENTAGIENCEGIIRAERYVRENVKEDIFFNTTVGTWASPFWFHFSDAVWRGQDDWNKAGTNPNDREAWITYRDKLVYDWFVKESPMCPINGMMTHGVIISKWGTNRSSNYDYKNAQNEIRCAFACGSGMVELYCDYELLNSINNGALWKDLADCLKWQREQADVLPDAHWVGGSPWDGSKHSIYGWASWNGIKATLALRNGDTVKKSYSFTLREALDIPEGVNTTITLSDAFEQTGITGITIGKAYSIDETITVSLPANSVFVFNGRNDSAELVPVTAINFEQSEVSVAEGSAIAPAYSIEPLDASNKTLSWSSDNEEIAVVKDGAVIGIKVGTATITATANDGSGVTATVVVNVEKSVQNDLTLLLKEVQNTYNTNNTIELGDNLITQVSQLSSNATETSEGKIEYLIDGQDNTFWHSKWQGVSGNTMDRHYLQVELPESMDGTILTTQVCRPEAQNDFVIACRIDGSNDGTNFTQNVSRVTFEGVTKSGSPGKTYKSTFTLNAPYKYLRFYISETTNNRTYGHFAEFQLNKVMRPAANESHNAEAAEMLQAINTAKVIHAATTEDVSTLLSAYEDYLTALAQNTLPEGANGFFRLHNTTGYAASISRDVHATTTTPAGTGAETVFYNHEGQFISYATGYKTIGATYNMTAENVTALPVTIGEAHYNTFCAPVAVSVPEELQAYVCRIEGTVLKLYNVVQVGSTHIIPANTGVLLYAPTAGTFELPIVNYAEQYEDNGFYGTLVSEPLTASYNWYALGHNAETEETAFVLKTQGDLAGFHAFVREDAAQSVKTFTLEFDTPTGLNTIQTKGQHKQYDLQGRRTSSTDRGFYILNAHKIIR